MLGSHIFRSKFFPSQKRTFHKIGHQNTEKGCLEDIPSNYQVCSPGSYFILFAAAQQSLALIKEPLEKTTQYGIVKIKINSMFTFIGGNIFRTHLLNVMKPNFLKNCLLECRKFKTEGAGISWHSSPCISMRKIVQWQ